MELRLDTIPADEYETQRIFIIVLLSKKGEFDVENRFDMLNNHLKKEANYAIDEMIGFCLGCSLFLLIGFK